MGGLVKYLAYPVVAGLTGAVALLVLKTQLPILLAWSEWRGWRREPVSPTTLLMSLVVIVVMVFGGRRLPGVPPQVIGLVVGVALALALAWVGGPALARLGGLPSALPLPIDPRPALRLLGQNGLVFTLQHGQPLPRPRPPPPHRHDGDPRAPVLTRRDQSIFTSAASTSRRKRGST